jgi:phytoene dehydrogenase-like protein
MGVSLFSPSPDAAAIARRLPTAQQRLFDQVFRGSLAQLLDEALVSKEAKALLAMVALNATLAPPSAPGTAIGLIMRPISLVSTPAQGLHDPRKAALRGSTGLPIGGMGAIAEALAACCRHHGVVVRVGERVAHIMHTAGQAVGVATELGDEYFAPCIVAAINPKTLFADLLDDSALGSGLRREIAAVPMIGSAFKMVLALDGLPDYANLPGDVRAEQIAGVQFRVAPSVEYVERAVCDGLSGRTSRQPLMWGLIPTVVSPDLAPKGRHLLSVNIWHAPSQLAQGDWTTELDAFGQRCIDELTRFMPNLEQRIVGRRFMGPKDLEAELGLVASHITHGDMLPGALFGARPHAALHDYRTPLRGLYLSGAGTWPGGYVTGVPGYNASLTAIADMFADLVGKESAWNSS